MHGAPAVTFVVSRARWPRRWIGVLLALGGFQTLWFLFHREALDPQSAVALLILLFALATAVTGARSFRTGVLQWDGVQWQWSGISSPAECAVQVHLDGGTFVLISLRYVDGRLVWLWLEATADRHQWLSLRRAIWAPLSGHRTAADGIDAHAAAKAIP